MSDVAAPDPKARKTVLLLAGTAEGRALAERLATDGRRRVVLSLAGATPDPTLAPQAPHLTTRRGGFGGAPGLARWLRDAACAAVLDATHPFAEEITRNAVEAAATAGVAYLRLNRPAWTPPVGADWREVADHSDAAAALPDGARTLLTTGSRVLTPYAARRDVWWAVRAIDRAALSPFPFTQGEAIVARPPFALDEELDLMRSRRISHLVAKNAGGAASRPKIEAAARLGLTIVLLRQPAPPAGAPIVTTVAAAMDWLEETAP